MSLQSPDEKYMRMALRLAEKAKGRTSPNPMVGALLVKNGRVITEGYHRKAGTPHAEALAIENAGDMAHGYINPAGEYAMAPWTRVIEASRYSEGLALMTIAKSWYERLNPFN